DVWGPTLIMLGGSAILVIFLLTRMSGSISGANNKALEFNKSRARRETSSKVKFSDVAGAEEEKVEMKEIVDYLKEPKKFSKFGAKLPRGILLVGPPGCGKTLLAKAVAGEAGVPFYSISGSDFVEMFVGVGAGRVRDMFRVAKENAPCLVFIDEIDAVGRQRGAGLGGGNDEREQTLNQLLVEMDGFSDNSGIIVIAATNRDDVLDPALLRAGRFDRKITVSLPDRQGREDIFKVHSRNKKIGPDVNFNALAKRTVGFSGADIENIMNEAAILAVRRNKDAVTIDDIDEAIDRRIAGPAKSSRSLNNHERDIVAYHEAGHAIIGLKCPHSDKVQKITIIPRGNTGGHVRMTPEEDRFLLTKKELEARIIGYLGGRSSEEIFFDDVSTGAQNDIEMATQIARMMVTELGMSSLGPIQYERDAGSVFLGRDYTSSQKNFSHETATKIDAEIRKIIDESHAQAKLYITKYKEDVELIAKTLLEHEQITAEEIDYLLVHRHLKRDEKPTATPIINVPNISDPQPVVDAPVESAAVNDIENGESKGE
ncbi:MAG: ATP-dependent zinc metalloprotease FtsH, partial [Bacilli bacterium]